MNRRNGTKFRDETPTGRLARAIGNRDVSSRPDSRPDLPSRVPFSRPEDFKAVVVPWPAYSSDGRRLFWTVRVVALGRRGRFTLGYEAERQRFIESGELERAPSAAIVAAIQALESAGICKE